MSMWWARFVSTMLGACFASSATRCNFVDTFSELDLSFIFPRYGSNSRRPPSLPRLPWVSVRPVHRYYAGALNRCFLSRFLSSSVVPERALHEVRSCLESKIELGLCY